MLKEVVGGVSRTMKSKQEKDIELLTKSLKSTNLNQRRSSRIPKPIMKQDDKSSKIPVSRKELKSIESMMTSVSLQKKEYSESMIGYILQEEYKFDPKFIDHLFLNTKSDILSVYVDLGVANMRHMSNIPENPIIKSILNIFSSRHPSYKIKKTSPWADSDYSMILFKNYKFIVHLYIDVTTRKGKKESTIYNRSNYDHLFYLNEQYKDWTENQMKE